MRPPVFLVAILFAAAPLVCQSNLASVEGKVVNSVTREPVKRAVVTLHNSTGQFTYFASTDQAGKFHIDNVQPEKYACTANAEGFANGPGPRVKLFTAAAAQQVTGIEIPIEPLSVISGKVLDDSAEPLDGVTVMAMRYIYAGVKTLQTFASVQTDDRGEYRIFDLQPGNYYLAASNRQISHIQVSDRVHSTVPEEGYGTLIYPGVADASQTSAHEVKPGEEWAGADFRLHKQPIFHIRGRINAPVLPGGGRATVDVEKCDSGPMRGAIFNSNQIGRPDGSFDISVVPGAYCLYVREPGRGGIAQLQVAAVTVKDADINDMTLTPPASISVKGTIAIDGTPPANLQVMGISLRDSDGIQQQSAAPTGGLTFQIDNIFPGKHTIFLPMFPQLYVKSILYGSQDVSSGIIPDVQPGASLSIVMGTDPGEIDGRVQLGSLESGAPVMLVAIPDDAYANRWDLRRFTSSSAEGSFTMPWLAPGDYKIFAFESSGDDTDRSDPDLLKLLEGHAAAVTVHANGHEQAAVTPISASEIEHAKEKLH